MAGGRDSTGDGRARLLAAGVELVVERAGEPGGLLRGLHPVEVAERAGLARSALYRYWPVGPDGSKNQAAGFQAFLADLAGELAERRIDTGALALRTLAVSDELAEVLAVLSGDAVGSGTARWWAGVQAGDVGVDWSSVVEDLAVILELVLGRAGYELRDGTSWHQLAGAWLAVCDGAALWERTGEPVAVTGLLTALVDHWCQKRPVGR